MNRLDTDATRLVDRPDHVRPGNAGPDGEGHRDPRLPRLLHCRPRIAELCLKKPLAFECGGYEALRSDNSLQLFPGTIPRENHWDFIGIGNRARFAGYS